MDLITKMETNIIYNEDCLIGMSKIDNKSIDMVLCDLPYGTTNCEWDKVIPLEKLWAEYRRVIKDNGAIVLTSQQPFTTDLINSARDIFRYEIIWDKISKMGFLSANKRPLRRHENIIIFYKKLPVYNVQKEKIDVKDMGRARKTRSGLYEGYSTARSNSWVETGYRFPSSILKITNWNGAIFGKTENAVKHPTQKPVPLFSWLIRTYTNEDDVILDNCMGSGTTAISCLQENRKYIGFETNEKYYNDSINRIEKCKLELTK